MNNRNDIQKKERLRRSDFVSITEHLENAIDKKAAHQYQSLLETLEVVVDLSLCGARTKNYASSHAFNGLSAVESAVVQMLNEGIQVVQRIEWI